MVGIAPQPGDHVVSADGGRWMQYRYKVDGERLANRLCRSRMSLPSNHSFLHIPICSFSPTRNSGIEFSSASRLPMIRAMSRTSR